jgi:hypothetical protein
MQANDETGNLFDLNHKELNVFLEKFAELLVRECVGLCDQAAEENARTFYTVTETQEVGPALVAKGSQVQAEKLSQQIKKHFGVEE